MNRKDGRGQAGLDAPCCTHYPARGKTGKDTDTHILTTQSRILFLDMMSPCLVQLPHRVPSQIACATWVCERIGRIVACAAVLRPVPGATLSGVSREAVRCAGAIRPASLAVDGYEDHGGTRLGHKGGRGNVLREALICHVRRGKHSFPSRAIQFVRWRLYMHISNRVVGIQFMCAHCETIPRTALTTSISGAARRVARYVGSASGMPETLRSSRDRHTFPHL